MRHTYHAPPRWKRNKPVAVGKQSPWGGGKRRIKAGVFSVKQYKARERHKHNGGVTVPNKGVGYWRIGRWHGGEVR